ncbi:MAG: lpxH [Deltaproteobacteria bacterium]|jgi:UDP-2,3-diacylglucosamine hydrolase|nr:lpxH [Deltaproteobacteria bacterium]
MRSIFFSDAHLARGDEARHALVRDFIRDVCKGADRVFVLGDLFEFYHGYDEYIYPWYKGVIDEFRALSARGTSLYYLEGNHDFDMGAFFSSYTGMTCASELSIDIDGKRWFVAHGDMVASARLGNILKSRPVYGLMNFFGPALSFRIAMVCRLFLSRRWARHSEKTRKVFREYAGRRLQEGYDAVILAHTHIPDIVEFSDGPARKTYLNTGDLIEYLSYGEYTSEDGFAIRTYKT